MEKIEVWRGRHGDPEPLFGPLPGIRDGDTLAYEFQLSNVFDPWPGRGLLERVFVLLDLGVSMSIPVWQGRVGHEGEPGPDGPTTWYVDLVHVTTDVGSIVVRDLFIDVIVPTDGRHQRILDLDEYGDAIESGELDLATAVDGLRRWQRFIDEHLHKPRGPVGEWTDFPPERIRDLAALPAPLGPIVTAGTG